MVIRAAQRCALARPCVQEDQEKLEKVFWVDGHLNADLVGQSAARIASMAGIEVPQGTVVLGVFENRIGDDVPFSHEKLCPILAIYRARVSRRRNILADSCSRARR